MKKNINTIFVICFVFINIFFFAYCMLNKNQYNALELRNTYFLKVPKLKDLNNNSYQNDLEKALSDQFIMSENLKIIKNKFFTYINFNIIKLMNFNIKNKYIRLSIKKIYKFNNKLISKSEIFIPYSWDTQIDKINNLKSKHNVNIYLYYVPIASDISFDTNVKFEYKKEIEKFWKLNKNNISFLEISDFKQYNEYFYDTDYHWNHKGSYQGYLDILNMMNLDNALIPIKEECYSDIKFNGYYKRVIGNSSYFNDDVCVYKFENDMANTKVDLNKVNVVNYEILYGLNSEMVEYNNENNNSNKNLLIYSNSFSNAVENLLATHFDNTYSIDGRRFDNFDMDKFLEEKNITDVLFLVNGYYFSEKRGW